MSETALGRMSTRAGRDVDLLLPKGEGLRMRGKEHSDTPLFCEMPVVCVPPHPPLLRGQPLPIFLRCRGIESKGIPAQSPRLRGTSSLGGDRENLPTPTGLRPELHTDDATPLGLRPLASRYPGVARASQPRAEGRNPFGIGRNCIHIIEGNGQPSGRGGRQPVWRHLLDDPNPQVNSIILLFCVGPTFIFL